jgi:hypothetical protein
MGSTTNQTIQPTPLARRLTRRRMMQTGPAAIAGLAALTALGMGASAARQNVPSSGGTVPTTGGARPGPMGFDAGPVALKNGPRPIALSIDKFAIAADVEQLNIVDGAMQNPTGPFVVSWYEETASPGEIGNVVLAGHVDYWNVGPAVFYDIFWGEQMAPGDLINVTGEDGSVWTYGVQFQQTYHIDELTPEVITDLIFPGSKAELVTLITCGGEFDANVGEYNSRVIVRGKRVIA